MFDDITKALTIKITADDLTGGAWSDIGKSAKELMNLATPINQAFELAGKAYEAFRTVTDKPFEWLSQGGELAEFENGLNNLAEAYKVNGESMLASVRELGDGSLDLAASMNATSNAIRMGFNEDQVKTIWEFADRYVHTMGGNVLDVATKIEEAIFTGKGKGVKTFGLNVAVGESFADIEAQMDALKAKLGEGVFDFGDEIKKIGVGFADMTLVVKKELDLLVGKEGFADFAASITDQFKGVEEMAPEIATGIFTPIRDALDILWDSGNSMFGDWFDRSDSLGTKITTIFQTIGNTAYDTGEIVVSVINGVLTPLNEVSRLIFGMNETALKMRISIGEWRGIDPKELEILRNYLEESRALSKTGLFAIDENHLVQKQQEYNDAIAKAGEAHRNLKKGTDESSKGIKEAGEAFGGVSKEAKKATDETKKFSDDMAKEIEANNKKIQDSQISISRKNEDIVKDHNRRLADIEADKQKELNKLYAEERKTDQVNYDKRKAIELEYSEKIKDENLKYQRAKEDAETDSHRKIEDATRAHAERLRSIQEDHGKKTIARAKEINGVLIQYGGITPTSVSDYGAQTWDVSKLRPIDRITTSAEGVNTMPGQQTASPSNQFKQPGAGQLKVSLQGIDTKLKDFIEYIIDQVTAKAIAEGHITAGV